LPELSRKSHTTAAIRYTALCDALGHYIKDGRLEIDNNVAKRALRRFEQWTNFYVIVSAAAATLLGLLFVVITLAAERGLKDKAAIRIFFTLTVIYLSSVLLMCAC